MTTWFNLVLFKVDKKCIYYLFYKYVFSKYILNLNLKKKTKECNTTFFKIAILK